MAHDARQGVVQVRLLQAQSGALQQLSIIVQQFTPQVDTAVRDRRDGLASLSFSDNDYDGPADWPVPLRGLGEPFSNDYFPPPPRRAVRQPAKPPAVRPAANRAPARRARGATVMAILGSRTLAAVSCTVAAAVVAYSYFPDLTSRLGKRKVEPVTITTTASARQEVRKDPTALGEAPTLPLRGSQTRAQPVAETPSQVETAVETAALPQRSQALPDIATTDPGRSAVVAGVDPLSPFPGVPRARDPAPAVEQGSPTTQVLATARPSSAAADTQTAPEGPPQFVAVVFTHQDRDAALDAFTDLRQRFPGVLARRKAEAQPIEIGEKGVWHRLVVLPAGTRQSAVGVCERLGAAGYDRCWVKTY
jgi:hypothetical protein